LGGEISNLKNTVVNKNAFKDILDESQGYIKEDKVTLEVQVKAEPPKNIL